MEQNYIQSQNPKYQLYQKKYQKQYWLKNKEKRRQQQKIIYLKIKNDKLLWAEHLKIGRKSAFRCYNRKKEIVFNAYRNKCNCCGENIKEFLTIDHVNNDGKIHRLSVKAGFALFNWAIKNNFPSSLQLLCWNCNMAKRWTGICPHELYKP